MLTLGWHAAPGDDRFRRAVRMTQRAPRPDDAAKEDERNAWHSTCCNPLGAGVVELHLLPSAFVIDAGPRPEAKCGREAAGGSAAAEVTNLRSRVESPLTTEARAACSYAKGARGEQEIATLAWPRLRQRTARSPSPCSWPLSGLAAARHYWSLMPRREHQHELLERISALEAGVDIECRRRPA